MKTKIFRPIPTLMIFALSLFIQPPAMAGNDTLRITAAANLTQALKKIGSQFSKTRPGVELQYNFGSSGSLAKQLDNGAPADLFFSASDKWMEHLSANKRIEKESVRNIAGNTLVLVSLKTRALSSLEDIRTCSRIAMGSPASVPAGEYSEQALRASGLYDTLAAQNRLVLTKDVRQALLYADRGEVDLAFVYRTDALLAKSAKIVFTVPSKLHKPIVFSMALTVEGQIRESAKAFYHFILSKEAGTILESYGYTLISPEAKPLHKG